MLIAQVLVASVAGLGLLLQVDPAEKQVETKTRQMQDIQTAFVSLTHLTAEEAEMATRDLGYKVQAAGTMQNPNRLMLRGSAGELQEIQQKVIPSLDVPAVPRETAGSPVDYIPLMNQPSGSLMQLLATVAPPDPNTSYAVDHVNQLLVVRGGLAQLAEIRRLVQAVDKPASGLVLQFFFIRGSIGSAEAERLSNLPEELATVSKTLLSNGLTDLSLMAPLIVNTRDGEGFETSSRLGVPRENVPTEPIQLKVSGNANLLSENGLVQVDIEASVDAGGMGTVFSTRTTVSAKLGSYTVLAAAPGTTTDGDAIALAVRATRGAE